MRLLPLALLVACSPPAETTDPPDEYAFTGSISGQDSVSYDGQVARHVLIADLASHLGALATQVRDGDLFPTAGQVEGDLLFYFEFDSDTAGSLHHGVTTTPAALQTTYDDVSSGKDLVGKLAGNDTVGQHVDWSTGFVGWDADGVTTPESLVRHWFAVVDAQAVAWGSGAIPQGPTGPVPAIHVTPEGQDLKELTQKFLLGAIAFSQGADDYLDDDLDGKGLLSDHTAIEEGAPYTALEHAWDEGFGYFGAARTYGVWSDEEIAAGHVDVDGDDAIDLLSEVCWGHSSNAAKRDLGAVAATDFTADAWAGFAAGRQLIAESEGSLDADTLAVLKGHRDTAVLAWEKAIAATVVHYINDTLQDMGHIGTGEYSFADHAKHWSELKGFALSLQFNPRSPLSDADFAALHDHLGTAPALTDDATYRAGLIAARTLIGDAYDFDPSNLGDDDGTNGW